MIAACLSLAFWWYVAAWIFRTYVGILGLKAVIEMKGWTGCLAAVVFVILLASWFGPARRVGPMVRQWILWLPRTIGHLTPCSTSTCHLAGGECPLGITVQNLCWADIHRSGCDLLRPIEAPRWSPRKTVPPLLLSESIGSTSFHHPLAVRTMLSVSTARFANITRKTNPRPMPPLC